MCVSCAMMHESCFTEVNFVFVVNRSCSWDLVLQMHYKRFAHNEKGSWDIWGVLSYGDQIADDQGWQHSANTFAFLISMCLGIMESEPFIISACGG